jgi:hypothetical protein
VRQRPQAEEPQEPVKQIEKPLPEALPAASTVDELRANLGKRKGTRSGRKVKPIPDKPTLDLDLIEKMFQRGATLAQIRSSPASRHADAQAGAPASPASHR